MRVLISLIVSVVVFFACLSILAPRGGIISNFDFDSIVILVAPIIAFFISMAVFNAGVKETAIEATATAKQSARSAAQTVDEIVQEAERRIGVAEEVLTEEEAYAIAAEELEGERLIKGLWAKAFSDAEGDERKQKALYLKYRAEQLLTRQNKDAG